MRFFDYLPGVLMVSALAFTQIGCVIHDEPTTTTGGGNPPPPTEASLTIDKGGALTTDPGSGVAILVEYEGPSPIAGASRWNIQTTCDTLNGNPPCNFDVSARSAGITLVQQTNAKSNDYVDTSTGLLHAGFTTANDIPGFTFDVPQGQNVEIEAFLDNQSAASYVFFQGSGVTHAGVPTNPVIFVPGS